jgi:hypothetical protein
MKISRYFGQIKSFNKRRWFNIDTTKEEALKHFRTNVPYI